MQKPITKGVFRIKDWWWSKAALLMGMVYLYSAWFSISFAQFLILGALSLGTIIGFATLGYLTNDLFDIKQDALAGKKNSLANKSQIVVAIFFLIAISFALLPWVYLPWNGNSIMLIGFQFFLFAIYSAPPVRLKERGIWGLAVDALYAHAIPVVLAVYTFSLAAHKNISFVQLIFLFSWQFTSGLRNILMHQADDAFYDRRAGFKSFANEMSGAGLSFVFKYLTLLEILLSCGFFTLLVFLNPLFLLPLSLIVIFSCMAVIILRKKDFSAFGQSKWKYFPNNLYEKWLPVCCLAILAVNEFKFIFIVAIHILIFNFDLYAQIADKLYGIWLSVFCTGFYAIYNPLRRILNYGIYYTFLVFGVNLKRENTSALGYFKKRRRGI